MKGYIKDIEGEGNVLKIRIGIGAGDRRTRTYFAEHESAEMFQEMWRGSDADKKLVVSWLDGKIPGLRLFVTKGHDFSPRSVVDQAKPFQQRFNQLFQKYTTE